MLERTFAKNTIKISTMEVVEHNSSGSRRHFTVSDVVRRGASSSSQRNVFKDSTLSVTFQLIFRRKQKATQEQTANLWHFSRETLKYSSLSM